MTSRTVDLCCGWYGWEVTGGGPGVICKLRRAGRKDPLLTPALVYNCALWPREHPKLPIQTVKSPSKCRGRSPAQHTTLLLPWFSGLCGPSETTTHTYGLGHTNCSWVAALFRMCDQTTRCYHPEMLEWGITKWWAVCLFICLCIQSG